jgi:hypothetical protein
MKRLVASGLVGLVLASVAGCGGPDLVVKELIANANLYAETLEKHDSRDRQDAAFERVRSSLDKFDKLSRDEQEKAVKRNEQDLRRTKERIDAALKNQALEGGAVAANPLDGFFK